MLPQNSGTSIGSYLRSIELWYEVLVDTLTTCAVVIYKATLPANGAAFAAPASQAFSYDAANVGAPARVSVDEHLLGMTITTPFWLTNTDLVYAVLTAQAGATPTFKYYAARLTFTLRL